MADSIDDMTDAERLQMLRDIRADMLGRNKAIFESAPNHEQFMANLDKMIASGEKHYG